jgi:hypothetical protein
LNSPQKPQGAQQFVPVDLAFAVYVMWANLLLSLSFAIVELITSSSAMNPAIRVAVLVCNCIVIKALTMKKRWARYLAVLMSLFFYAFLAFDANGLTRTDFWHMLAKAPVDVFVISRLFRSSVAIWLDES